MNQTSGWITRLRQGLAKSSDRLRTPLVALFKRPKIDAATLEALEEILLQSDMGVRIASELTERFSKEHWKEGVEGARVLEFLGHEITQRLQPFEAGLSPDLSHTPWVCLLVGVNGSGKTTTAGKLAAQWTRQNLKVGLVAGDTFRAAATEQLEVWSTRSGAHFYAGAYGRDSASLAFESFQDAQKKGVDVLLIDTAGRLHNKAHLMDELSKMVRVLRKQDPALPHATLLVLDATTGQNAISQVELFQKAAPLSGLILTKLDGSAKGGILLDLTQQFSLPIQGIGVGEHIEDLQPFSAAAFSQALLGI